ncbi:MAG: hypothetical protein HQ481_01125 [Alphaproteobacteria bacterium]|nr:hypothetical protein [Alphaproteobacteria bacterium]
MPRPKLPADQRMETVSARVTREMADGIDAYLETMRAETPLLILNRADAIRQILAIGLQKISADGRRKGGGKQ